MEEISLDNEIYQIMLEESICSMNEEQLFEYDKIMEQLYKEGL